MPDVSNSKVATGMLWKSIEVIIKKVISTLITLILARLLSAEEYGLISVTTIFITFSLIFTQNGLCLALIRKSIVSDSDIDTVVTVNILFSILLYGVLFVSAPIIASFYEKEMLTIVLRVLLLVIIIQSVSVVPRGIATRNMNFKVISISSTISSIVSGIIGIVLAFFGFGVWALVAQQLCVAIIDTIVLLIGVRIKFKLRIVPDSLKQMYKFSLGSMGTSFVDFFGNNFTGAVIGKTLTTDVLGIYSKGCLLPETIGLELFNIINSVALPSLAPIKNDIDKLNERILFFIRIVFFVLSPIMIGLLIISNEAVNVLLTNKWTAAVPIMQCFCIYYLFNPCRALSYNILYAIGQSKTTMIIEAIRCTLMVIASILVLVILKLDVNVMARVVAEITVVVGIGSLLYVSKKINTNFQPIKSDLIKTFTSVIIMMLAILFLKDRVKQENVLLIVEIIVGTFTYIISSALLKNGSYFQIKEYVYHLLKK